MIAAALDVILGFVVAEALILTLALRRRGRSARPLLATLAAGFFLMLAVRLALDRRDALVALCLLAALAAHLADLAGRWRAPAQPWPPAPPRDMGNPPRGTSR